MARHLPSLLEGIGLAALVVAAALFDPRLGLAAVGALAVLVGVAADRKP